MKLWLRRLYFRIFKRYRQLEVAFVSYRIADAMIQANVGKPEAEQWVIDAKMEDKNTAFGFVYLERRERITE